MKKYKYAGKSIGLQPPSSPPATPKLPLGLTTRVISGSRKHRRRVIRDAVLRHCKASYAQLLAAGYKIKDGELVPA